MATLYSNELKAIIVADNFLDNPKNVLKENCLTIQRFEYLCEKKRNALGEVYGPMEPVILKLSVRVNSPRHTKVFYKNLLANERYSYSILFNATFNTYLRLENYEDGLVVNGHVVSVEENYNADKCVTGEEEQMMLDVTIMASSVTYLGREEKSNYKSVFIQ